MNRHVFNAMKVAAVVLVACWLVSNAAFSIAERSHSKHEKRVLDFARRKEAESDSLAALVDTISHQKDSLTIIAAEKQKTIVRRIESVREVPVPAEAQPLVDTLNAIIDDQQEVIATQKRVIDLGREAEAELRRALVASDARGDSAIALLQRPKPKQSRIRLGGFAGPCATEHGWSRLCVGGGLNF